MPLKKPQPINYWAALQGPQIIRKFLYNKLIRFSIDFVKANKWSTASFSKGFNFTSQSEVKSSSDRLAKLLISLCRKKVPSITDESVYKMPYITSVRDWGSKGINIHLYAGTNDPECIRQVEVLRRYLQRTIYGYLTNTHVPIKGEVRVVGVPGSSHNVIQLRVTVDIYRGSGYLALYRLIFKIPSILQLLLTLHRKAVFNDDSLNRRFKYKYFAPKGSVSSFRF